MIHIHHIAAIASNFSRTIPFYRDILGLKVIHKYSLVEGPKVCHFYWDNKKDKFITFYHCPGLRSCKPGTGTVHTISFSVCISSLSFWTNRLRDGHICFTQMTEPTNHSPVLCFTDPDGLALKLVFGYHKQGKEKQDNGIPFAFSINGIYSIEILSRQYVPFAKLFLERFKMKLRKLAPDTYRFYNAGQLNNLIDVAVSAKKEKGASGCGTIHHLALEILDWSEYTGIRRLILESDKPTISRSHPNGYSSIYFWETDEILLELLGQKNFFRKMR